MLPEQFPPAFISSIFGHTFAGMYSSSGKSSFNSTGGWWKGKREGGGGERARSWAMFIFLLSHLVVTRFLSVCEGFIHDFLKCYFSF